MDERSRLIQRSYSTADLEGQHGESMAYTGPGKVAGGTVMGIHNLAIVFPQFIVSPSVLLLIALCGRWKHYLRKEGDACRSPVPC